MHTTYKALRTSARWYIAVLAIALCRDLHAQPSGKAQPVETAAQVLALSADPKARVDYVQVGRVLKALPPADRKTLHGQLIAAANSGLATMSARVLITEGDADCAALVALHISSWPVSSQGAILQHLADVRGPYIAIPRAVVREAVKSAKTIEEPDSPTEPVGMAAILLAKSGNQADRQMLLDLVNVRPRSWGVWMAIAHAGAIDSPRVGLASPVYKDPKAPVAVRVAAATALEPLDSQAALFVIGQAQSFLTRFANEGGGQMLGELAQPRPGDDARKRFADFRFNFHLLGSLLVLKNSAAQQTTFQYLTARNEFIRDLCGIVAAVRWPDQLLKAGQGNFADQEYADLIAFLALNHPDQAAAAAVRITPDRMASAKAHITRVGLGVFGLPGNILKVF